MTGLDYDPIRIVPALEGGQFSPGCDLPVRIDQFKQEYPNTPSGALSIRSWTVMDEHI